MLIEPITGATLTRAISGDANVFALVRMPSWAMSPAQVASCYRISKKHIFSVSDSSNMKWVYAASDSADVVDLHPFWNGAEREFIDKAVRVNTDVLAFRSFAQKEQAVSSSSLPSKPVPVACNCVDVNLAKKPLDEFRGYTHGSYHTIVEAAGQL